MWNEETAALVSGCLEQIDFFSELLLRMHFWNAFDPIWFAPTLYEIFGLLETNWVSSVQFETEIQDFPSVAFDSVKIETLKKYLWRICISALHGYRNPEIVADTVIECVGMGAHANKRSKRYRLVVI